MKNKKKPITLNKLIEVLTELRDKVDNGDYEVEFWKGNEWLALKSISHFNVYPTTSISFLTDEELSISAKKPLLK